MRSTSLMEMNFRTPRALTAGAAGAAAASKQPSCLTTENSRDFVFFKAVLCCRVCIRASDCSTALRAAFLDCRPLFYNKICIGLSAVFVFYRWRRSFQGEESLMAV
jgi:hypothetical protein